MTSAAITLLETFPGWPDVVEPSAFQLFMLCLGAPILVGIVMAAIVLGGGGRKQLAEENAAAGIAIDERPAVGGATAARRALPANEAPEVDEVELARPAGGATAAH